MGFNAATDTYENLVKAGVIDPTKVVRTALQDAASVAGLLITTEAAIAEIPEDKSSGAGHARHGRHGRHGRRHGLLSPPTALPTHRNGAGRSNPSGPFASIREAAR